MKLRKTALALIVALAIGLAPLQKAEAVVTSATAGGYTGYIVGSALLTFGGAIIDYVGTDDITTLVVGIALGVAGAIVLDAKGNMELGHLSDKNARSAQIGFLGQNEFNRSVDEINLLAQDVYDLSFAKFGHLTRQEQQQRAAQIQAFTDLAWAKIVTDNQAAIDAGLSENTVSPIAFGTYLEMRGYFNREARI